MYRHEIFGKELVISNKAYEALVRKWRVGNIKQLCKSTWFISGMCSFCISFSVNYKCLSRCPFYKYKTKTTVGCKKVLESIIPPNGRFFNITTKGVYWNFKNQATACVSAVEAELKKFRKVEK